jgi:coproporphyrinogen III oxidase-like Fe-S oxidoreductase
MTAVIPRFKDRKPEYWTYPRMSIFQKEATDRERYFSCLDDAPSDAAPLRVYLHIPFCKQFCVFCPYFKKVYGSIDKSARLRLFQAFAREIAMYAARPQIGSRTVASIYFGGGDPAVISIEEQDILWSALRNNFNWAPDVDITMEGTALSFTDSEKLAYFKTQGVTRTSFGVQTFDETIRPRLNLEPTVDQIYEAAEKIREAGFELNVDMMYNLPGQSYESFLRDIELICGIDPIYIDFYALQMYPNTVFLDKVKTGDFGTRPTNENGIRQWREIMSVTRDYGWNQVTSVTFSKRRTKPHRGFDHTLRGFPVIGIGPTARSFICGRNFRNHSSNERYLDDVSQGRLPVEIGSNYSTETAENFPFVFFPIRLYLDWATVEASPRNRAIVDQLMGEGYLERQGDRLILTTEGRVWAGNIQRVFFDEEEHKLERTSLFQALRTGRNPYNQDFMGVKRGHAKESE